jgi:hypothetical protein
MSRFVLAMVPFCCVSLVPVSGWSADDLVGALKEGKTSLNFRLRHEQVDDEAFTDKANATTLRTRLTYVSGQWQGLDATIEFDHVGHLFDERFNDTRNGNTTLPMVVDPKGADLNQAALRYRQGILTATGGRQRILLDNQRFVGGVGWRQNEQTYDALRLAAKPADDVQLDYIWISNTRRIFGPEPGTPPAALISDNHLLNVKWTASKAATVGAYVYALDFANAAASSSLTTGGYVLGEAKLGESKLDYRAEYARQTDYADNPNDYSADYLLLSAGMTIAGVRFGAAMETLGADADAGVAMQTPLATLHMFQGWADKFLNTPNSGVEDLYFSIGGSVKGTQLQAIWHEYKADVGSATLGTELNLLASRKFAERYTLTAKYADYQADSFSTDTKKFWLMAEASF